MDNQIKFKFKSIQIKINWNKLHNKSNLAWFESKMMDRWRLYVGMTKFSSFISCGMSCWFFYLLLIPVFKRKTHTLPPPPSRFFPLLWYQCFMLIVDKCHFSIPYPLIYHPYWNPFRIFKPSIIPFSNPQTKSYFAIFANYIKCIIFEKNINLSYPI